MLYQHSKTGARVKIISEWDDGDWFMVEDQDGRLFTAYKTEIAPDENATKKVKTLQVKDKAAKEEPRDFPPETRLNINSATAQMIADHIKGIGLKSLITWSSLNRSSEWTGILFWQLTLFASNTHLLQAPGKPGVF
jgi:hypothetical protein